MVRTKWTLTEGGNPYDTIVLLYVALIGPAKRRRRNLWRVLRRNYWVLVWREWGARVFQLIFPVQMLQWRWRRVHVGYDFRMYCTVLWQCHFCCCKLFKWRPVAVISWESKAISVHFRNRKYVTESKIWIHCCYARTSACGLSRGFAFVNSTVVPSRIYDCFTPVCIQYVSWVHVVGVQQWLAWFITIDAFVWISHRPAFWQNFSFFLIRIHRFVPGFHVYFQSVMAFSLYFCRLAFRISFCIQHVFCVC